MTVDLEVRYEAGHSHRETWEHDLDLHCPSCGETRVWVKAGAGDYYEGPQHLCTGCRSTFSLPRLHAALPGWQNEQRLDAIGRAG